MNDRGELKFFRLLHKNAFICMHTNLLLFLGIIFVIADRPKPTESRFILLLWKFDSKNAQLTVNTVNIQYEAPKLLPAPRSGSSYFYFFDDALVCAGSSAQVCIHVFQFQWLL